MRFSLVPHFAVVSLAATVSLASCTSDDAPPLFMEMNYQLRCGDCDSNLPNDPIREVDRLDGEDDYEIDCIVSKSGDKRQISISMKHADPDYKIGISQAFFEQNDPGSECEVTATEAGNTYVGKCSAAAPTEARPCQLSFEVSHGIVTGSVLCKRIANPRQSPPTTRFLVEGLSTTDKPAKFEVHGCRGL
jgi:hypothetical protein